jgi:hypothetical protein
LLLKDKFLISACKDSCQGSSSSGGSIAMLITAIIDVIDDFL